MDPNAYRYYICNLQCPKAKSRELRVTSEAYIHRLDVDNISSPNAQFSALNVTGVMSATTLNASTITSTTCEFTASIATPLLTNPNGTLTIDSPVLVIDDQTVAGMLTCASLNTPAVQTPFIESTIATLGVGSRTTFSDGVTAPFHVFDNNKLILAAGENKTVLRPKDEFGPCTLEIKSNSADSQQPSTTAEFGIVNQAILLGSVDALPIVFETDGAEVMRMTDSIIETNIRFEPLYSIPFSPPVMALYLLNNFLIPQSSWTKIPYSTSLAGLDNGTTSAIAGKLVNGNLGIEYLLANSTFYNRSGYTRFLKVITQSLLSFNENGNERGTRVTVYQANGQPRLRVGEEVTSATVFTYGGVISSDAVIQLLNDEPFTVDVFSGHDTGNVSLISDAGQKTYTMVTIVSL